MKRLYQLVRSSGPRGDVGATATEYGLLVSFIALAITGGAIAFGTALEGVFNDFASWVTTKI